MYLVIFKDPKSNNSDGRIEFDGIPYMILGRKVFECQHRVDRHENEERGKREAKIVSGHCKMLLCDEMFHLVY
jgi:hypothetical protein